MAQAELRVQVNIKEIYDVICEECRQVVHELIREKVTDEMVKQVIGGE